MGALASEADAHAEAISRALEQKRDGNPLAYFRLQHALSAKSPTAIADVLTGLTHFAARLHHPGATATDLRALVDMALSVNLSALAAPMPSSPAGKYPALDALHLFLVNLVSADAAYVEPVLHMLAANAFTLPLDRRAPVVTAAYAAVAAVLDAYPRAASLLADVLRARYPHPVRPAAEHCAYARSVLHVAREARNGAICRSIVATVFERLGAVEALVPGVIFRPVVRPVVMAEDGEEGDGEEEEEEEVVLTREAEKMQLVLLELFRHVDLASKNKAVDFRQSHFEPMFAAYEASIVPIEGTRFSPYVMLYAASVAGQNTVLHMVERLRQSFFDPSVSERLREKFLQHSSAIVIRAALVSSEAALKWISFIAKWLNRYVDAHERRSSLGSVDIDTDIHHLFYCACCALMTTISKRPDAFTSPSTRGSDPMDRMRLYRVMSCGMNPLLVIPVGIVEEFSQVLQEVSGMDISDIIEENKGKYTPSRTRYGSRNRFSYTTKCPDLELPYARSRLEQYIRSEDPEEAVAEDEDRMDIGMPIPRALPDALGTVHTPSNMMLSASLA